MTVHLRFQQVVIMGEQQVDTLGAIGFEERHRRNRIQ
jgi:hypothetical protein